MVAGTETAPRTSRGAIPDAARWLGALGAIPFVGLAMGSWLAGEEVRGAMVFALAAYGAVILSFLGGIHWGLAMAGFGSGREQDACFRRLTLSIVPSLVGWVSLLAPAPLGLAGLAGAFAAMLGLDILASRRAEVPSWYVRLRWPLTLVVTASVIAGAAA